MGGYRRLNVLDFHSETKDRENTLATGQNIDLGGFSDVPMIWGWLKLLIVVSTEVN
ncbi:MAG TPA: hypothetical protein P5280_06350 [Cyclobacteriaceae bacterium]|nr:hypothetical protein [Cyclobacteriaceae bacterium]